MSSLPPPSSRPDRSVPAALSSSSNLDFRTLLHVLLEKAWLVVLCFVVAALLTAIYIQRQPRIFAASATLQVEQQEQKIVKVEKVQQEDLRYMDVMRTIEQTLASRPLLERVLTINNLDQVFTSPTGDKPSREQMVSMLGNMVDVRLRRGTRLIDVTVRSTSPALCEKIANSLVREFMRQNFEQHSASSQVANEFLVEEAQRLKNKLQESEISLQAYRESTGSISLEERHNIAIPRLKELSQRANEARSTRTRIEVEVSQVQNLGADFASLLVSPAVANDATVQNTKATLAKLENDFATLRQRYKEKHPKYVQAIGQLEDWRNTYTNAVLRVPQTLTAALESARAAELALEAQLAELESGALQLSRQSIQYNVLAREVEADRALYESVLTRLKETGLTKELQSDKVRIVQPAYTPESPISPNKRKLLALGLVAGLALGVMLALGLNAMDSSLKGVDQTEELLKMPVLSAVPQVSEVKGGRTQLIVAEDSTSPGAESFRSLRTSISMLGRSENRRTVLFTSALPQEGKTFCSLNYAACLAQQGLRTLLVDGDLRRPAVEQAIHGKRTNAPGVTDFLTGQESFDKIIRTTDIPHLSYISAGSRAPNPAELLAQGGFDGLIDKALENYDRVVVDSAPIHAVSDALLMLTRVQTVSVVVRAGKTPRRAISRALQILQKAGAPVGGVILNRLLRRRASAYYYDPYYDYSYRDKKSGNGVYGVENLKSTKRTRKPEPELAATSASQTGTRILTTDNTDRHG